MSNGKGNRIKNFLTLFIFDYILRETVNENDIEIAKDVEGTVILHLMFAVKQNQEVGRILINIFKVIFSIFVSKKILL